MERYFNEMNVCVCKSVMRKETKQIYRILYDMLKLMKAMMVNENKNEQREKKWQQQPVKIKCDDAMG